MESDPTVYYSYKYLPILLGVLIMSIPLVGYLDPDHFTVNGESGPPDWWTTAIFVLIGLLIALLPFLYMEKMVIARVNNQKIIITRGEEVIEFNWIDVERINMLPLLFPPIYKLRVRKYDDYFLFNTTRWGAQFIFFTWDWSEMGSLIRRKKEELGI